MNATDVLHRLQRLGISVWADGDNIFVAPASKIPAQVKVAIREHKPGILARLRPISDSQPVDALLERLRKGHTWLLDLHQRWQTDDTSVADDAEFSRVWNVWWELDQWLRAEHGFHGCIYGPDGDCPDGFPCQGCSEVPAAGVAAQLTLVGAIGPVDTPRWRRGKQQ